jgi:hypothetical protein
MLFRLYIFWIVPATVGAPKKGMEITIENKITLRTLYLSLSYSFTAEVGLS